MIRLWSSLYGEGGEHGCVAIRHCCLPGFLSEGDVHDEWENSLFPPWSVVSRSSLRFLFCLLFFW